MNGENDMRILTDRKRKELVSDLERINAELLETENPYCEDWIDRLNYIHGVIHKNIERYR